jgi:hypothetical protein
MAPGGHIQITIMIDTQQQVDSCGDRQCTSGWLSENPRRRSLLCETVSMKSSPDVLSIPDQYGYDDELFLEKCLMFLALMGYQSF